MNIVIISGNLTADPQVRATKTGKTMTTFSVAINEHYTYNGETKESTTYVNCIAWGGVAEMIGNNFHKGSQIIVHGKWENNKYTGKDGIDRTISRVNVKETMLPPKQKPQQSNGFNQFGPTTEEVPF